MDLEVTSVRTPGKDTGIETEMDQPNPDKCAYCPG